MELISCSMESSVDPPSKKQLGERSAFLRSIRQIGAAQAIRFERHRRRCRGMKAGPTDRYSGKRSPLSSISGKPARPWVKSVKASRAASHIVAGIRNNRRTSIP